MTSHKKHIYIEREREREREREIEKERNVLNAVHLSGIVYQSIMWKPI